MSRSNTFFFLLFFYVLLVSPFARFVFVLLSFQEFAVIEVYLFPLSYNFMFFRPRNFYSFPYSYTSPHNTVSAGFYFYFQYFYFYDSNYLPK